MYISKKNRKLIDEIKKETGLNLSDNSVMTIIKKAKKAAEKIKIRKEMNEILENDPLGILQ